VQKAFDVWYKTTNSMNNNN